MCGICGFWSFIGDDISTDLVKCLFALVHRGPDGVGVFVDKKLFYGSLIDIAPPKGSLGIGHALLRIVGELQPISNERGDLWVIHNGEIYNYKVLRRELISRGHKFFTYSDSEAILHLFEEGRLDKIVGDYAFALLDLSKNELHLYRDFIGIRPLFYCKDRRFFGFASEMKGLLHFCDEFEEVTPGHHLIISHDGVHIEPFYTLDDLEFITVSSEAEAVSLLKNLLYESIQLMTYSPSALYFSGGIDSSILALILKDLEVDVKFFTTGLPGSHDLKLSTEIGSMINIPVEQVLLNERQLEYLAERVVYAIEDYDPLKVSIAIPLYAVSEKIKEEKIRVAYSGQGADELFGGYARYIKSLDPLKEMRNDVRNLYSRNLNRDDHVAMANSVEVRYPYLYEKIVSLALSLPLDLKIRNGVRKYILKLVLRELGLGNKVNLLEKKAVQYGTGVMSALKKIAKRKKMRLIDYLKGIYNLHFG